MNPQSQANLEFTQNYSLIRNLAVLPIQASFQENNFMSQIYV